MATVSILLIATIRGRCSRRSWGRRTWSSGAGRRGSTSHTTTSASDKAVEGRGHQAGIERPLGVQHPRGVQEQELALRPVDDAQEAVPGGLGLGRRDGQLLPHQPVQEGGLAHVGEAHEGDVAAFEVFRHAINISIFSTFFAD